MAHCWSNDDTANSLHNLGSCRFGMAVPIRLLNRRIELIDIAINLFHRKRVRCLIRFTDYENRLQADTVSTRIGQNNALHRSTTRCFFGLDSVTGSCSVNADVRKSELKYIKRLTDSKIPSMVLGDIGFDWLTLDCTSKRSRLSMNCCADEE